MKRVVSQCHHCNKCHYRLHKSLLVKHVMLLTNLYEHDYSSAPCDYSCCNPCKRIIATLLHNFAKMWQSCLLDLFYKRVSEVHKHTVQCVMSCNLNEHPFIDH